MMREKTKNDEEIAMPHSTSSTKKVPMNIVKHLTFGAKQPATKLPAHHGTSRHYRPLQSTSQQCSALHSNAAHFTALQSTSQHCRALHSTAEHFTALQSTSQQCSAPFLDTTHTEPCVFIVWCLTCLYSQSSIPLLPRSPP